MGLAATGLGPVTAYESSYQTKNAGSMVQRQLTFFAVLRVEAFFVPVDFTFVAMSFFAASRSTAGAGTAGRATTGEAIAGAATAGGVTAGGAIAGAATAGGITERTAKELLYILLNLGGRIGD